MKLSDHSPAEQYTVWPIIRVAAWLYVIQAATGFAVGFLIHRCGYTTPRTKHPAAVNLCSIFVVLEPRLRHRLVREAERPD